MTTTMHYTEEDQIRTLLVGRSVAKVADNELRLDDGRLLTVVPNEGGCSCAAGDYELTELNDCPNMIMAVEFDQEDTDHDGEGPQTYRVFVLAENQRIKLLEVSGDDGNGYYGTGWWLEIKPA